MEKRLEFKLANLLLDGKMGILDIEFIEIMKISIMSYLILMMI